MSHRVKILIYFFITQKKTKKIFIKNFLTNKSQQNGHQYTMSFVYYTFFLLYSLSIHEIVYIISRLDLLFVVLNSKNILVILSSKDALTSINYSFLCSTSNTINIDHSLKINYYWNHNGDKNVGFSFQKIFRRIFST